MATNLRHRGDPNVVLPLAVGEGVAAGDIIKVGTGGLTGYVLTDRATSDTVAGFTSAPGLVAGQAAVELIGISVVVDIEVAGGVTLGAPIYVDSSGDYTKVATDNHFIGYALQAITNGAVGKVGLASFEPAIVTS